METVVCDNCQEVMFEELGEKVFDLRNGVLWKNDDVITLCDACHCLLREGFGSKEFKKFVSKRKGKHELVK